MDSVLAIIFALAIVFSLQNFGTFLPGKKANLETVKTTNIQYQTNQKNTVVKTNYPKIISPASISQEAKPSVLIQTYITSGPNENETVEDTNEVTFEFKADVFPEEKEKKLSFETKLEGLDEKWITVSSQKRVIKLPAGTKEYTFLVRGKIENFVDPTPAQRKFKINISPYFGKVKISNLVTGNSKNPCKFSLNAKLQKEENICLDGWKIKGKKGVFVIPKGIKNYHPLSESKPEDTVFLEQGEAVSISCALNPLGNGNNFKPNKCMGYLTEYYKFPLSISMNCPKPKKEEISHLSPCCQDFIYKTSSCKTPNYSKNQKISVDSQCVSYINQNLNYDSCFRKYFSDEDFLGKGWHIYMNKDLLVRDDCDVLYLYDQNGLLVDKYSYGQPVCKW